LAPPVSGRDVARQHAAAASDSPIAKEMAISTPCPVVRAELINAPKVATPNAEPLCLLALSTPAAIPARHLSTVLIIAAVAAGVITPEANPIAGKYNATRQYDAPFAKPSNPAKPNA
jgi:hypothetical protein